MLGFFLFKKNNDSKFIDISTLKTLFSIFDHHDTLYDQANNSY